MVRFASRVGGASQGGGGGSVYDTGIFLTNGQVLIVNGALSFNSAIHDPFGDYISK